MAQSASEIDLSNYIRTIFRPKGADGLRTVEQLIYSVLPRTRVSRNKIITNGKEYTDTKILNGNIFLSNSLAFDELTIDTLNADIDCSETLSTIFRPKGSDGLMTAESLIYTVLPRIRVLVDNLSEFSYGQRVEYYRDGNLFSVFYMESVKRISKFAFAISCVSSIGLLDNETHYGGIYKGALMKDVIRDIIGGVVPYTLDARLQNAKVYGWLPIGTRRENLHQLLFAEGGFISKRADGAIWISPLTTDGRVNISDNRMYLGGDINYIAKATSVFVTEHSYAAYSTDEDVTLYEGEVVAESIKTPAGNNLLGTIITFKGPMHSLRIQGASILESGANYAVLGSSTNCTLTGKSYTHITKIINRGNSPASGQKNSEISVSDATLVSFVNSEAVISRIYAYYGRSREVDAGIVVGSERPGTPVEFTDPFDEIARGFIQSLDIDISNVLKADAKFVVDYEPAGFGDFYSHYAVITSNQTWTVPSDTKGQIRVVMIGGGQGGSCGGKGEDSKQVTCSFKGTGFEINYSGYGIGLAGEGGRAGNGGQGGKILQVTIQVKAGQQFGIVIGSGGKGAAYSASGAVGSLGGNTTFGTYSSASGVSSDKGFSESFSGVIYASRGEGGIPGGKGSGGVPGVGITEENIRDVRFGTNVIDEDGHTWTVGTTPLSNGKISSIGSSKSAGGDFGESQVHRVGASASYQPGSGAAAGSNGQNGGGEPYAVASKNESSSSTNLRATARGVPGLNGATATKKPRSPTRLGQGGRGGYGGGGAGGHGFSVAGTKKGSTSGIYTSANATGGTVGMGGAGGPGGDGAPGGVIVYW